MNSGKQRLTLFVASRLTIQEIQEEVLQAERKWQLTVTHIHREEQRKPEMLPM